MFFTDKKRKKNLLFSLLALTFFCGVVFLAQTHGVRADSETAVGAAVSGVGFIGGFVINVLLYPLFVVLGWVASLAVSIFEWVIKPEDVTLLLNSPGVYESWKFVRDFFNLFFILVLLYIAFTVVFQINKDFKKALLSLVLAALYINFSFPVSRALIDMTNVPMYFFANQMMARNPSQGTGIFGGVMTATNLERILLPGSNNGSFTGAIEAAYKNPVPRLLMAIVFMFLFSVTLLVLSIMFVIRLVGLVVLVIFSSVGFAASIIPGLEQYSKMWWDNFWKYAIFGPAAMLMLLIATRFFAALGGESGSLMKSMKIVTSGTVVASDQTFFASMVLFTIQIIMLWFAMGLAQKMSIAGASSVVGLGQKFSLWAGKTAAKRIGRGYEHFMSTRKGKLGAVTKWLAPSAVYKGGKAYFEHQEHEDNLDIELAQGSIQNDMNKAASKIPIVKQLTHRDSVNYRYLIEQGQMRKAEDEIKQRAGSVINENTGRLALAEGIKEHDRKKFLAAFTVLAKTNGMDNVVGDYWKNYVGKKDAAGNDILKQNADGSVDIQANHDAVLKAMMDDMGIESDVQETYIYNFGEIAKVSGDESFAERATPDMNQLGKFNHVSGKQHAESAVRQMMKMRAQGLMDAVHGRTFAEQQVYIDPADGKEKRRWGDVHDLAEEFARNCTENLVNQASRMKPEAVEAHQSLWDRATDADPAVRATVTRFIDTFNEAKNIEYRRFFLKSIGKLDKKTEGETDPSKGADPLTNGLYPTLTH